MGGQSKAKSGFDISAFDVSVKSADGVEFQLKDPDTGAPVDIFITVCGRESEQHKKSKDKANEKVRRLQMEEGRKWNSTLDVEMIQLETIKGDIISWRGMISEGVVLDCTPGNVRKILERHSWVISQAWEVVNDRKRFLPGD